MKPPACCHPPSPCEWRPTGGFDAPTLGGRGRCRQRRAGARNYRLWTGLWVGWGRAGVFLWIGRDGGVHADLRHGCAPSATCADGKVSLWMEEIGGFGRLEAIPRAAGTVPCVAVHSVVQVSDAGGTVPAWLLSRVQCQTLPRQRVQSRFGEARAVGERCRRIATATARSCCSPRGCRAPKSSAGLRSCSNGWPRRSDAPHGGRRAVTPSLAGVRRSCPGNTCVGCLSRKVCGG